MNLRIVLICMVFSLPTLLLAQDLSWYNTQSSSYTISTEDELKGLQYLISNNEQDFNGKTIRLASNIVLTSNWTPIGSSSYPFKGIFDGQGKTISGLSVNGGDYAGLFGYVENGQIKNLNVVAAKIKTATGAGITRYSGGLAAYYASDKPIENCGVQADSIVASGFSGAYRVHLSH